MDVNLREWDFLGKVPCVPEGQGTVAGDEGVAPGEEGGEEEIDGLVGAEDGVEEALSEGLDGGSGHGVSLTIEVGMRNEEDSVGIVKFHKT